MVVVRLARGGSKKKPFYRIVVADSRRAATGKFLEALGFYNPLAKGQEERIRLDLTKIDSWVSNGAQISPRVKSIIKEMQSQKT